MEEQINLTVDKRLLESAYEAMFKITNNIPHISKNEYEVLPILLELIKHLEK